MIAGAEPLPEELAEPLARARSRLGPFGDRIRWYPEVSSTNDVAATLAAAGEGCVVVANAQTAGRGRHGRTWISPPAAGLYVSVVLTPPSHAVPLLTLAAGVAVADGIQAATGLTCRLKWPNDVYAGDRKIAGVLAESDNLATVILGFGINLLPAAYPPDVASRATSVEGELGRPIDRGILLAECLAALAARSEALYRGDAGSIVEAWRVRAGWTFGRRVGWGAEGAAREGLAENIDDTGALLVRAGNELVRVIAGEVRWM